MIPKDTKIALSGVVLLITDRNPNKTKNAKLVTKNTATICEINDKASINKNPIAKVAGIKYQIYLEVSGNFFAKYPLCLPTLDICRK